MALSFSHQMANIHDCSYLAEFRLTEDHVTRAFTSISQTLVCIRILERAFQKLRSPHPSLRGIGQVEIQGETK